MASTRLQISKDFHSVISWQYDPYYCELPPADGLCEGRSCEAGQEQKVDQTCERRKKNAFKCISILWMDFLWVKSWQHVKGGKFSRALKMCSWSCFGHCAMFWPSGTSFWNVMWDITIVSGGGSCWSNVTIRLQKLNVSHALHVWGWQMIMWRL